MADQTKFVVVILHKHGSDFGSTIGKIMANNAEDAMARSEMWITRKNAEHECREYGNNCSAYVDIPNRSLRTCGIDLGAEEIDLTNPAN